MCEIKVPQLSKGTNTHKTSEFYHKISQDSQKVEADLSESLLKVFFWVAVIEKRIVCWFEDKALFKFISDFVCVCSHMSAGVCSVKSEGDRQIQWK